MSNIHILRINAMTGVPSSRYQCYIAKTVHSAQIRTWLRNPTDAMLAMAGIGPGDKVLDVAAGAGDQTLDIAERVGSAGAVLATDLSPVILEFCQRQSPARSTARC